LTTFVLDFANRFLRVAGIEIRRNRGTLVRCLTWLRDNDFPVNTVLDVGASDGRWSDACLRHGFPKATYALFEPNPTHHASLTAFCRGNSTVLVYAQAVSDKVGKIEFNFTEQDPFAGAISTGGDAASEVECTTIDHAVEQGQLKSPFLLKLDTHGFESEILQGAKATLGKCSVLIIEAYNFYLSENSWNFWQLCQFLDQQGFRCVDLIDPLWRQHDGAFWQMDLVFVRKTWPGFAYPHYR
jgi:FkbM family methyltransferase